MPAAALVDVQVQVWQRYREGDRDRAREIQHRLLPLIHLGSLYGVTFNKEILCRRGIIASRYTRDPQREEMDSVDLAELDEGLEEIADLLTV
jgi:dihydrodipicolinate synthase/N-acetylneuraminate lyase